MSLWVLDTDTLSLKQHGHPVVHQYYRAHLHKDLAITVITVEEQLSGWYHMLRQANRPDAVARAYQQLADTVPVLNEQQILPFPVSAIARYEQLKAMRLNVRANDLRIAAIVLDFGGTLVTRNLRDFQRVPNLPLEDWTV
jgi:tRNA(fMet)-specific endonuclease VapC